MNAPAVIPAPPRGEQAADGSDRIAGLLPHEVFFGLFLLVTWVRLGVVVGWLGVDALIYLGLIVLNFAAIWYCRSTGGIWPNAAGARWRVGLLYYPLAMNFIFFHLKTAIPRLHPGKMDSVLGQIDSLLMGVTPSLRAQVLVHPALTEFFSLCYILFFPYLLFSQVYYFLGDLGLLRKFVIGLFTIYGLGFLGYSFVPAAGPCHAIADMPQRA